jgi:hypothetical protein
VAYPGGGIGAMPSSLAVFTIFYFKDLYLFVYMNAYYNMSYKIKDSVCPPSKKILDAPLTILGTHINIILSPVT